MNKVILLTTLLVATLGLVYGAPSYQRAELEAVMSVIQDAIEQADESELVEDLAHVSASKAKIDKLRDKKKDLQRRLKNLKSRLNKANEDLCKFSNTIAEICASYSPTQSTPAQGKQAFIFTHHMCNS